MADLAVGKSWQFLYADASLGDYTVQSSAEQIVVVVQNLSTPITVHLPEPSTRFRQIIVKDYSSNSYEYPIYVDVVGGSYIDGFEKRVVANQHGTASFFQKDFAWWGRDEKTPNAFAQIVHTASQTFTVNTPTDIVFNTVINPDSNGMPYGLDFTPNTSEITIKYDGLYHFNYQPQVISPTSAGFFKMWAEFSIAGNPFTNLDYLVAQQHLANNDEVVMSLAFTKRLTVGDIVKFVGLITDVGIQINIGSNLTGPACPPALLEIVRVGD